MESLTSFINRKVVILHESDTVYAASRAMKENNIGAVVVADSDGFMRGMLTDRDLACGVFMFNLSQETHLKTVMETGLIWATEYQSLQEVVSLMIEHSIRRVPIVKHTRRGFVKCVGFVSLDDLICFGSISIDEAAEVIKPQLNGQAVILRENDDLYRASDYLCEENVGAIVVTDKRGYLVGMATDRDIACAIASPENVKDIQLKEIMDSDVVTASPNDSTRDIIEMMVDHSVRRIPIIKFTRDGHEKPVGMESLDSLIARKEISIEDSALIIGGQITPKSRAASRVRPPVWEEPTGYWH